MRDRNARQKGRLKTSTLNMCSEWLIITCAVAVVFHYEKNKDNKQARPDNKQS